MTAVDPYPQIKAVIERELEQLYELQKEVFAGRPQAMQPALDAMRSVEEQLEALEQAVGLMVTDPIRFGLSSSTAYHRQVEVEDLRFQFQDVKGSLDGVTASSMVTANGYAKVSTSSKFDGMHRMDLSGAADQKPGRAMNDLDRHQAEVMMIVRQQDEELDDMSKHIDVIKDQSYRVFEELGEQEVLLGYLDEDADMTRLKLRGMTKRVQDVIKKSGGCSSLTVIIILLVVLLVLFVLAFT